VDDEKSAEKAAHIDYSKAFEKVMNKLGEVLRCAAFFALIFSLARTHTRALACAPLTLPLFAAGAAL